MADFFRCYEPPHNAWLGVTVEDRKFGLPRLDWLRQVPAHIRFVSVEPLLEDLGTLKREEGVKSSLLTNSQI